MRGVLRIAILLGLAAGPMGCASMDLGPWGGPAYRFDAGRIGTGEPSIIPRNDETHWDGVPLDSRSHR